MCYLIHAICYLPLVTCYMIMIIWSLLLLAIRLLPFAPVVWLALFYFFCPSPLFSASDENFCRCLKINIFFTLPPSKKVSPSPFFISSIWLQGLRYNQHNKSLNCQTSVLSLKTWSWLCFTPVTRRRTTRRTRTPHQISRLLLTQFWPNFKHRHLRTSTTDSNCSSDICTHNICPGDIYVHIRNISDVTCSILTKL